MSTALLGLLFFSISFGITDNFGAFSGSFVPIVILLACYIALIAAQLKPFISFDVSFPQMKIVIPVIFLCTYTLFIFHVSGWWVQRHTDISMVKTFAAVLFIPLTIYVFLLNNKRYANLFFYFFILSAFIMRLVIIHASPWPPIDVYAILREAPQKFLAGVNPYNTLYTHVFPGITPDYFAYWPAAFILQIPFITLLPDPRILHILADIGTAILIYLIGNRSKTGSLLALLYLFRPLSLFIIEGSWLTPLDFFFVTLTFHLLVNRKHPIAAGILLGILTSIQFFFGVLFLFFGKYLKFSKKFTVSFLLTVSVIVFPFFALEPGKFFSQTIGVYFRSPPHPSILIHTSLNINTLFFTILGKDIPSFSQNVFIFAIFIWIFIKQMEEVSAVVGSSALFFYTVFLFGRQAFANYYYLVASFLILWMAVLDRPFEKQHPHKSQL